jgi:LPXTG-motif cell wall-anchored protein
MNDDLPTPECKPTPHPDAIASGTCPSPSTDPIVTDPPTEPLPTDDTIATTEVPAPPAVEEPTLPTTGPSTLLLVGIGMTLLVIAAVIVLLFRRRKMTW